jgi:GNAT superfamily N-acetyltransferase
MPPVPQVHLVRPEDVPVAAASLVRAFYDDPMLEFLFPDPATRGRALRRFFTLQLRQTPRHRGLAYTTEGCHATALWVPPRTGPPGLRDMVAQIPKLFILGKRAGAALALVQLVDTRHPKTPHYYLGGLGTDPQWQGRGLGSAVLAPVLERCDRDGVPAYLESSKESNVAFYAHRRFEVIDEVSIPESDVRLWLMWREPLGTGFEADDA